jgi:hypothetical protein
MCNGKNGNDTSDNDETNDCNNNSDQVALTCGRIILNALVLHIGDGFRRLDVGCRRQGFVKDFIWVIKLNDQTLKVFAEYFC